MKKKYIILLLVSGVICILLPLTIDLLFNIGEKHPIIVTRLSASDILSYCSGVIGIFLSVVAIIMSLKTNDIDSFVNSIYLYDDHFIITFNYKNTSKKFSLKEINSSSLTSSTPP